MGKGQEREQPRVWFRIDISSLTNVESLGRLALQASIFIEESTISSATTRFMGSGDSDDYSWAFSRIEKWRRQQKQLFTEGGYDAPCSTA